MGLIMDYWSTKENLATDIRLGHCPKTAAGMVDHAVKDGGLNVAVAAEYVERFYSDINRTIARTLIKKAK